VLLNNVQNDFIQKGLVKLSGLDRKDCFQGSRWASFRQWSVVGHALGVIHATLLVFSCPVENWQK